jgi:hypothetical protein
VEDEDEENEDGEAEAETEAEIEPWRRRLCVNIYLDCQSGSPIKSDGNRRRGRSGGSKELDRPVHHGEVGTHEAGRQRERAADMDVLLRVLNWRGSKERNRKRKRRVRRSMNPHRCDQQTQRVP